MDYPVVAEIWSLFEATLLTQAKRLVEDISKHEGKDPKELWSLIKPQIRIKLFETDIDEPKFCTFPLGNREGVVSIRCRAPCVLGFDACHMHSHATSLSPQGSDSLEEVKSVKDSAGVTYYVDSKNVARDINGKAKGVVEDDVLYLFETVSE
jgi:hypothetical protein